MNLSALLHGSLVSAAVTLLVAMLLQLISGPVINFVVKRAVRPTRGETKLDARKRANTISVIVRTTFTAILVIATICTILGQLASMWRPSSQAPALSACLWA